MEPYPLWTLLLSAVLLQTLAVTVTVLHFKSALNAMKQTFARSSVSCLTDTQESEPCFQVRAHLQQLIEESLSLQHQRQLSSAVRDEVSRVLPALVLDDRTSSRPKVAAHVTGRFVPKVGREAPAFGWSSRRVLGQKIWWWEGQRGLAFLQDVTLSQGELLVSRPGLYYVYAQVYFRHHQGEPEEGAEPEEWVETGDRGRPLLQYVYKKINSYPVPILLMKTSRTSCWSRDSEFSLHSAHQGGLFPLTAGDRLFVSVTNASAVDMDERSSFFGAFLLS
ncbi:unnamed protein product [Knipowitschia caucasica]|uniref:Tumor necrosis factor ligand superfamily member 10 n=1 Tax=Knipowitschia caucasica TaxID=637954 RepID=A0AAV2L2Z9_KNICA